MRATNAIGIMKAYTHQGKLNDLSSFVRISNKFPIIFVFKFVLCLVIPSRGKKSAKTAATFAVEILSDVNIMALCDRAAASLAVVAVAGLEPATKGFIFYPLQYPAIAF